MKLSEEYRRFLEASRVEPATALSTRILESIRADLQPSTRRSWSKMIGLHLAASLLTLLVCPQFGVGPLGGGHGIMSWVMPFGAWACALFCGGFFLGATSLLLSLALSPSELKWLEGRSWRVLMLLAIGSLALFMARSLIVGEIYWLQDKAYLLLWLASSLFVGQALLRIRLKSLNWSA
jgi:hypothetical protein